MLDRALEASAVQSSLQSNLSVSVYGGSGIGKTTFLSHMSYLPETNWFSDGVVYLYAKNLGLDDLLQIIFDVFYTSPDNVIPTIGQLRRYLQSIQAVIFLDELSLGREDAQALLNIMPSSSFVLSSLEQSLWGNGQTILLRGLPEKESFELFVRELGRNLSNDEAADVQLICSQLDGNPLKIIHAASLIRSGSKSIAEIKAEFQVEPAKLVVDRELFNSMDSEQKKALAILSAASGSLVPLAIITSLIKLTNVQGVLDGLVKSGLAWNQGSQYGISGTIMAATGKVWDVTPWRDALVNYFAEWVIQQPQDKLVEEASDLLLQVINYAGEKNRWPEVIRIGRAVERILVLQKRWQAWLDILNLILKAARAYGDRYTEAWVLHQLGTRAMCMNYLDQARQLLTQALNLRQAIGDKAGIAVTQHNLAGLPGVLPPVNVGNNTGSSWKRFITCGTCGFIGIGTRFLIGMLALFNLPSSDPPSTATRVPTRTDQLTDTITPSFTPTDTPTNTATLTPTKTYTPSFTPTFTPTRTKTPTKTRVPTITPDTVDPPTPDSLSPRGQNNLGCLPSQVVLIWTASNDPSGISNYDIQLRYRITKDDSWSQYPLITVSGNLTKLDVTNVIKNLCNPNRYYRWRVRATDGAGNSSNYSTWRYFRAQPTVD